MQDVVVEGTIETEHEVKAEGILSGITAEQATKAEGLFALAATGGLCIPLGTMAGTEANVVGIPGFWEGSLKTEQKVEISFVQAKVESKVETDAINAETTTFAAAPPTLTVISNAAAIGTMEVEASGYATNLLGVSHMEADKKSNALYTITAAFAMCPPAFAFDYSEDAETGAEADAIASYPDPVAEVDID
jgi:hypothetical protein